MVSLFKFLLVSLVFTLGTTIAGHAASFDCNKATTETEIAICGDPELSALDEFMAELYGVAHVQYSYNDKQASFESIGKIIHPNLTSSINIFFEKLDKTQSFNMATGYDNKLDSDQCVQIFHGYLNFVSSYTAVFSSLSNFRDGIKNNSPTMLNFDKYLSHSVVPYPVSSPSLASGLNILNALSITDDIVIFMLKNLDIKTQQELIKFLDYTIDYRNKNGDALIKCFDEFEETQSLGFAYASSSYTPNSGQTKEFKWEPINEYLDGFWKRRISDGTDVQVQSIFELVANFEVLEN